MIKHYDYIIVGSGLFGATFAYKAHKAGKKWAQGDFSVDVPALA